MSENIPKKKKPAQKRKTTITKENKKKKALEVLRKASRGKTIGIISHVEMLKEEIEKQINVKVSNTKSYIECKGV